MLCRSILKYSLAFVLQGTKVKGEEKCLRMAKRRDENGMARGGEGKGEGKYVSKYDVQRNTNFGDIHIRKAAGLKCFSTAV
jgi:hypothetical protein